MKLVVGVVLLLMTREAAMGCGPGRGAGRRRGPSKLTPLVFKQHVPNVSENTLIASGQAEGRIRKEDNRFRELLPNYNPDIVFRDDEGTGADRLMTQRCMDKLNNLAISVMNQWPGVKVRVTEGWDEENHHGVHSLHYEGRAVDITTSDKDRSKYGLLAGLAVEAGFDWVYYESRSHIHCSVKSDSPLTRSGGCFTGNSTVTLEGGVRRRLYELKIGDRVLSVDESTGKLVYSEVIMFLDRDGASWRQFMRVETSSGQVIEVTPSHLVLKKGADGGLGAVFAGGLVPGDTLMVAGGNGTAVHEARVVRVSVVAGRGVFAPLTATGNLLVDGVLASCYAVVRSQSLAHYAFVPVRLAAGASRALARLYRSVADPLLSWFSSRPALPAPPNPSQVGVHWYAKLLYQLSDYLLPSEMMYRSS